MLSMFQFTFKKKDVHIFIDIDMLTYAAFNLIFQLIFEKITNNSIFLSQL